MWTVENSTLSQADVSELQVHDHDTDLQFTPKASAARSQLHSATAGHYRQTEKLWERLQLSRHRRSQQVESFRHEVDDAKTQLLDLVLMRVVFY